MEDQKEQDINPQEKPKDIEETPKKKISDTVILWPLIIIILFLLAIFGLKFIYSPKQQVLTIDEMSELCLEGKLDENDCYIHKGAYVFVRIEGLWYTRVQSKDLLVGVPLHFHPGLLQNIPVNGQYNHLLFSNTSHFYITFDPIGPNLNYVALAIGEFDRNMLAAFNKTPIASCSRNETEACHTRPIINCTNTDEPVVFMKQADKPAVTLDDNCIIIQGDGPDLVRATDKMLLLFYDII